MAAILHTERRIVDRRLRQYFNSTREQWIEVVKAAVAARGRCTDNNAKAAPGFYAWDAATARARQLFRREGWDKGDHNGIEIIVHHDLKKMIAVMNTDAGTCDLMRSPRNRTLKGPASESIIDLNNQGELFKASELGPDRERPYQLWYLCIFDDGGRVRAELSRPSVFHGGYVVDFSERILILEDGEWEKVALSPPSDAPDDDFAVEVRRK
jgi:hypothetical protein